MARIRPKITVFGWPSHLGGADTKLAHLLELLHKDVEFTVVKGEQEMVLIILKESLRLEGPRGPSVRSSTLIVDPKPWAQLRIRYPSACWFQP